MSDWNSFFIGNFIWFCHKAAASQNGRGTKASPTGTKRKHRAKQKRPYVMYLMGLQEIGGTWDVIKFTLGKSFMNSSALLSCQKTIKMSWQKECAQEFRETGKVSETLPICNSPYISAGSQILRKMQSLKWFSKTLTPNWPVSWEVVELLLLMDLSVLASVVNFNFCHPPSE